MHTLFLVKSLDIYIVLSLDQQIRIEMKLTTNKNYFNTLQNKLTDHRIAHKISILTLTRLTFQNPSAILTDRRVSAECPEFKQFQVSDKISCMQ